MNILISYNQGVVKGLYSWCYEINPIPKIVLIIYSLSISTKGLTQLIPVSTVHIVQVVAVLLEVLGVCVIESQTVSTSLQFRSAVITLPVLITRQGVGVETVVVRTLEVIFLCARCNKTRTS